MGYTENRRELVPVEAEGDYPEAAYGMPVLGVMDALEQRNSLRRVLESVENEEIQEAQGGNALENMYARQQKQMDNEMLDNAGPNNQYDTN